MPAGIQSFSATGEDVFTSVKRSARIVSIFVTGTSNGSATIPETGSDEVMFFSVPDNAGPLVYPEITLAGRVVSWVFNDFSIGSTPAARTSATVYVGVF